jgi:hypothetical protein
MCKPVVGQRVDPFYKFTAPKRVRDLTEAGFPQTANQNNDGGRVKKLTAISLRFNSLYKTTWLPLKYYHIKRLTEQCVQKAEVKQKILTPLW